MFPGPLRGNGELKGAEEDVPLRGLRSRTRTGLVSPVTVELGASVLQTFSGRLDPGHRLHFVSPVVPSLASVEVRADKRPRSPRGSPRRNLRHGRKGVAEGCLAGAPVLGRH